MQAIVTAYKDPDVPKKIQSTGLHIAGEKYIVLKADDTSLYGKKVSKIPSYERRLSLYGAEISRANTRFRANIGQGRRYYRQDKTSAPHHALSRDRSGWRGSQHGGEAWDLSVQRGLLRNATVHCIFQSQGNRFVALRMGM